jgi:hypothetical protein
MYTPKHAVIEGRDILNQVKHDVEVTPSQIVQWLQEAKFKDIIKLQEEAAKAGFVIHLATAQIEILEQQ